MPTTIRGIAMCSLLSASLALLAPSCGIHDECGSGCAGDSACIFKEDGSQVCAAICHQDGDCKSGCCGYPLADGHHACVPMSYFACQGLAGATSGGATAASSISATGAGGGGTCNCTVCCGGQQCHSVTATTALCTACMNGCTCSCF